jgi:hypothetical protein
LAVQAHGEPELSFSLSHSGEIALYAFARTAVGVDVERDGRGRDGVALAARAFGSAAAEGLARLDAAGRERAFLRSWVRLEAVVKRDGAGLAGTAAADRRPSGWVGELELGPRAVAAFACGHPPRELRCWSWAAA